MTRPIYIVASLWIREGSVAAFEAYEHKAARLMQKYGGAVEHAVRLAPASELSGQPFEVHLVRFPSPELFAAYRSDSELKSLAPEREMVITRTEIMVGYETPAYAA